MTRTTARGILTRAVSLVEVQPSRCGGCHGWRKGPDPTPQRGSCGADSITKDDGIEAPGIEVLDRELRQRGKVVVVARCTASCPIRLQPSGEHDEKNELWRSEGYARLWVMKPVMEVLTKLNKSMQEYPNVKPGQDFGGCR